MSLLYPGRRPSSTSTCKAEKAWNGLVCDCGSSEFSAVRALNEGEYLLQMRKNLDCSGGEEADEGYKNQIGVRS